MPLQCARFNLLSTSLSICGIIFNKICSEWRHWAMDVMYEFYYMHPRPSRGLEETRQLVVNRALWQLSDSLWCRILIIFRRRHTNQYLRNRLSDFYQILPTAFLRKSISKIQRCDRGNAGANL